MDGCSDFASSGSNACLHVVRPSTFTVTGIAQDSHPHFPKSEHDPHVRSRRAWRNHLSPIYASRYSTTQATGEGAEGFVGIPSRTRKLAAFQKHPSKAAIALGHCRVRKRRHNGLAKLFSLLTSGLRGKEATREVSISAQAASTVARSSFTFRSFRITPRTRA